VIPSEKEDEVIFLHGITENVNSITNIIFDLGGVILDIDYQRPIDAFKQLGITDFEDMYAQAQQDHLFDEFETGKISPAEFRHRITAFSRFPLRDEQIDYAWNSILISLPQKNVEMLRKLSGKYRLFILSNTNAIHEKAYREMIIDQYGSFVFDDLFEKTYLSHHVHLRKPDPEIFKYVLKNSGLEPGKTLFIDDSEQHVEGAKKTGLISFLKSKGEETEDLLKRVGIL